MRVQVFQKSILQGSSRICHCRIIMNGAEGQIIILTEYYVMTYISHWDCVGYIFLTCLFVLLGAVCDFVILHLVSCFCYNFIEPECFSIMKVVSHSLVIGTMQLMAPKCNCLFISFLLPTWQYILNIS